MSGCVDNREAAEQWLQKGWQKLRELHDVVTARRFADKSKGLCPELGADELIAAIELKTKRLLVVERVCPCSRHPPPSPRALQVALPLPRYSTRLTTLPCLGST